MDQRFKHKLIQKAIKRYQYNDSIDQCNANKEFYDSYCFLTEGKRFKSNIDILYVALDGTPGCNHIAAKNLLFQDNEICWKYFERTALFWSFPFIVTSRAIFIDEITGALNYALYVERTDLIRMLLTKLNSDLERNEYKQNKEYINQKIYPGTYLTHFLVEKMEVKNSVCEKVIKYGAGANIYERILNEWDSFSNIENDYWDKLCEYHLNGIGVTGTKWKDEEFCYCGLIPMELINTFKVRQKLGLDLPAISHELFMTPMAAYPKIPTGYNQDLDVKFQLVERTKKNNKRYTYEDIIEQLQEENGEDVILFY